ncbi:MAG: hypothetical protein ACKVKM_13270 [Verrucomicrobiia bacterium]|jgi:hypothetical protein
MMLGVVELLFEFIIEIVFEGAICGFFGLLGEFISAIFEKTSEAIEGATEAAVKAKFGFLILLIMLIMGAAAGYVISLAFPERIFQTIPVTGISLLITPLLMGGLMSLVGVWKANHDCAASFLGTFMGGAIFGLAAAGTRLVILSQG